MSQDSGVADSISAALSGVSKNIAVAAGIVGAFVSFGSGLTSCSQDNIERHKTFREAVASEEKFWRDLYDDFLDTMSNQDLETVDRDRRLAALRALANHPIPSFLEYRLGFAYNDDGPQREALRSINAIRNSLEQALGDPQAVGAEQADIKRTATFQSEEDTLHEQNPPAAVNASSVAGSQLMPLRNESAAANEGVSYNAQTLATGAVGGWNIDVFWCAGGKESVTYGAAKDLANAIAQQAEGASHQLADNLTLDRVRLRILPLSIQERPGYPSSGNQVRGERSEQPQMIALANFLNRQTLQSGQRLDTPFKYLRVRTKTPDYLSVFVCSVPGST